MSGAIAALVIRGSFDVAVLIVAALALGCAVVWFGALRCGRFLGLAGLVLNSLTLPAAWAGAAAVRGTALTLGDVALLVGCGMCLTSLPLTIRAASRSVVMVTALLLLIGGAVVLLGGAGQLAWQTEALRVLRFGAAAVVGMAVALHSVSSIVKAAAAVVWQASTAVLANVVAGVPLVGAVAQVNSLVDPTSASAGVLRYQIPSSQVALVFLACSVCAVLLGHRLPPSVRLTTCAAAVLTFLNFSRNSVVVVVLSALMAVAVFSPTGRVRRGMRLTVAAGVLLVLVLSLSRALPGTALATSLDQSIEAFSDRVLIGFGERARNSDSSIGLRRLETAAAINAVRERPIAGFGFGVPYRDPINYGEFWARSGRTYVHNAFLWLAVKTGVAGLGAMLLLGWLSVRHALKRPRVFGRREPLGACALSVLLAMLVVSIWVPYPIDPWAGPVMAVLAAVVYVSSCAMSKLADAW